MKENREMQERMMTELKEFKEQHEFHRNIDQEYKTVIESQLEILRKDTKMKDVHKMLKNRYKVALEENGAIFLGVSDLRLNVKSVMGTKILNCIIAYHSHKCQFTNYFKDVCRDTLKQLNRLDTIYNCNNTDTSSGSEDEVKKVVPVVQEDPKILDIKNKLAEIVLDVEEEW